MGVDIEAGELVIKLKQEFSNIRLYCFQPYETQANNWTEDWRERYFNLLAAADWTYCLQPHYTKGCMHKRNREMVDRSSRLIAIHDGIASGGTAYTIQYAKEKGLEVIIINPLAYQTEQEKKDDSGM